MKKVAVIGLGSFGTELVLSLSKKKNIDIIAIDSDEFRVNEIKELATLPVTMDGSNKENLVSVGIENVDCVVVSAGPSMEPSILTVHILHEMGIKQIIAKALSADHEKILRLVGATDIIFPERDEAQKLGNQIDSPNLIDYLPLQSGYMIQEIAAPDKFVGKTLQQTDIRKKFKVTVLAIKSIIPDTITTNPGGDVRVKESDILIVFGTQEDIDHLHRKTIVK